MSGLSPCDFDPTEVLASKEEIDGNDFDFKNVLRSLTDIDTNGKSDVMYQLASSIKRG